MHVFDYVILCLKHMHVRHMQWLQIAQHQTHTRATYFLDAIILCHQLIVLYSAIS